MAHESMSKKIRDIIQGREGEELTTDTLSRLLHIQTRQENRHMLNTLSELYRAGKIWRLRQGVYGPAESTGKPDKREIMWRVLRMRNSVTIADLQEIAKVSERYAQEWLNMLVKRDVVVPIVQDSLSAPIIFRLIKSDLVEMPVDTAKAERLRNLRLKKKQAITQQLGVIGTALGEVREILKTMEDEA